MKANELRLGNWVMGIGYMRVTELKTELDNNFITASNKDVVYMDEEDSFQPIELTEEVLLKIGFVKENEINRMYNNRCVVSYYIGNFYKELVIEVRRENGFYKNNMVHYDIKYLHQLQNAYYLLTNEELEVNL